MGYCLDVSRLTFPNQKHPPAQPPKFNHVALVPAGIALKFWTPEAKSRFWHSVAKRAAMLMPKTAMDEDDGSVPGKHEVR